MNKKFGIISTTSIVVSLSLWCNYLHPLFGGKTELDLNGIDVIKESAEILAHTAKMFPTHKMVIGIIGFIMFAQGLSFFCKGMITLIVGNNNGTGRIGGLVTCIIGLNVALLGALCSLFCYKIACLIFAK